MSDPVHTAGQGLALSRVIDVDTRSVTAENPTGAPCGGGRGIPRGDSHPARDLGPGWKASPAIMIPPGETTTLADITGPGCVTHLWLTSRPVNWRRLVLRVHWEADAEPAVEAPLGDFFCTGWGEFAQVSGIPVAVNPHGGFNSYWEMPFRDRAAITLENTGPDTARVFYQVDYWLGQVPDDIAYLHAQWRRSNPLETGAVHPLLTGVSGPGHYVGTYLAWGSNSSGWWGEGEVRFYLDGDGEFPTICGTGTEDYFGGAWGFKVPDLGYATFTTPYLGMPQVLRPDGLFASQQRFGLYRFHLPDPIRFRSALRADVQALGWRAGGRYLQLHDDIASMAFFYSTHTSTTRPDPPTADTMEIC